MNNLTDFQKSLENYDPPEGISQLLTALWYAGKGNWNRAHDIAQDIPDKDGAWVHAYLHREEGDEWNASYWYKRGGRSKPSISLQEEWESLVKYFIKN